MTMAPVSPGLDPAAFAALTRKIAADRAFSCGDYKDTCLARRIAVRMRATGVHDYSAYATVLDRDPAEYDRLLDALTINVTRLFRNREAWDAVSREVWPVLFRGTAPVRVWSAACSTGEEPVTIAVSALEWAAAHGADAHRLLVHATDIDARALERARAASFAAGAFTETLPEVKARWFSAAQPAAAVPAVTQRLRIERRDLLLESPPASGLGFIACRNVLIYFERDAQDGLLKRMHDALAPGGFLLLGKVESLLGAAREWFQIVDGRERLYRRAP